MIDIRIEGEPADLTPGTAITLERFNPLLDFETVQGSRVYGFDLPDTPTNRRLLGYFYQPMVGYEARKFRCEKYVHGYLIEQGYVMIREVKPGGFSLYFTQNLGEIFGDYQAVPLNQIDFGTDALIANPPTVLLPSARYAYPTIINPNFYGNQAIGGYSGRMNNYAGGAYDATARVPMPLIGAVLREFYAKCGWSFQGDFMNDPDLQWLIYYNLFSLDSATSVRMQNHLPGFTLGGLLIELRKLFNLYLEFDVSRKICTMDFGDDVLKSDNVLDWTDIAAPTYTKTPQTANRLDLSYDLDSNDALLKPIPPALDKYTTPETPATSGGSLLGVRSRVSTLLTDLATGLATTSQAGLSLLNKDNRTDAAPRVLFWNGMVNGLPTATAARGNRSLGWNGPNGLAAKGYTGFERFRDDTFGVKQIVWPSAADLALFSFRRKVHIRGVTYIVGSIKAALNTNERAIPCEVDLWRV